MSRPRRSAASTVAGRFLAPLAAASSCEAYRAGTCERRFPASAHPGSSAKRRWLSPTCAPTATPTRQRSGQRVFAVSAVPPDRMTVLTCDDDGVTTREVADVVRKSYPNARHVAFTAGGHYPHVNRPEEYNELLRAILLERSGASAS